MEIQKLKEQIKELDYKNLEELSLLIEQLMGYMELDEQNHNYYMGIL